MYTVLQFIINLLLLFLANFLVDRWRRAIDVQKTASVNYQSLVDSSVPSQSRIVCTYACIIMSCAQQ